MKGYLTVLVYETPCVFLLVYVFATLVYQGVKFSLLIYLNNLITRKVGF